MLREVLPSDLVEPQPEPEVVEDKSTADEANATYVGGVRMDEYGEFVHDEPEADEYPAYDEAHHELPGLTDEALRLIEAAREELAAAEAAEPTKKLVPLALSAFLTSRKKVAAAELADWIDSEEGGRRRWNPSVARCRAAATAVPAPWCWPTTTTRRSRACGRLPRASSIRR